MNEQNSATSTRTPAPTATVMPPLHERQKRHTVYAMHRQTVLVKFTGTPLLPGLEEKRRNDQVIRLEHGLEAQNRGLDFRAYRQQGDTGHQKFNLEPVVSGAGLVDQLQAMGLRYTGGHWQKREGKGPVSTLQFSAIGEVVPLPDSIRRVIESAFATCTVWCNPRFNNGVDNTEGQHRLDTINLSNQLKASDPRTRDVRRLVVEGNTYDLV